MPQPRGRWWKYPAITLIAFVVAALVAGIVRPQLLDYLPASVLSAFRPALPPEPKMHSVFGLIDLDGKVIAEGEIRFVPVDKALNPDHAKIKDGKYFAQVKDVDHKVEIRGMKDDVQFVPAKFNDQTELTFNAKAGSQDFHLRSNP